MVTTRERTNQVKSLPGIHLALFYSFSSISLAPFSCGAHTGGYVSQQGHCKCCFFKIIKTRITTSTSTVGFLWALNPSRGCMFNTPKGMSGLLQKSPQWLHTPLPHHPDNRINLALWLEFCQKLLIKCFSSLTPSPSL